MMDAYIYSSMGQLCNIKFPIIEFVVPCTSMLAASIIPASILEMQCSMASSGEIHSSRSLISENSPDNGYMCLFWVIKDNGYICSATDQHTTLNFRLPSTSILTASTLPVGISSEEVSFSSYQEAQHSMDRMPLHLDLHSYSILPLLYFGAYCIKLKSVFKLFLDFFLTTFVFLLILHRIDKYI